MKKHRDQLGKREESGFTLVELLVVIIILGILAAVVVFSVSGITKSGKKAACQSNVGGIASAVETMRANTGSYPASMGVLAPDYVNSFPVAVAPAANSFTTNGYTVTYDPATHAVTAAPTCDTLPN